MASTIRFPQSVKAMRSALGGGFMFNSMVAERAPIVKRPLSR
jgi:hypothetical protein